MKKIIETLKDKIQAQIDADKENDWPLGNIKTIFVGDPYWIPASAMPCVIIWVSNWTAPFRWTKIEVNWTIQINLVSNIRDFYNNKYKTNVGWYEDGLKKMWAWDWKMQEGLLKVLATNELIDGEVELTENISFTTPIRRRDDAEKSQAFTFEPTLQFSFKSINRR